MPILYDLHQVLPLDGGDLLETPVVKDQQVQRAELIYDYCQPYLPGFLPCALWDRPVAGPAHHRLLWTHPFLDGNGRIARLFTDAWLRRSGIAGYGLWSVSRGLARFIDTYREALASADSPRRGDRDGRGALSQEGLARFTRYFLETCQDQVRYMREVLSLETLSGRLRRYTELWRNGMVLATPRWVCLLSW